MYPGYTGEQNKGFQQLTDLSAAVGLTVPAGSAAALIQCTAQAVRWRDDGTNPSSTVGMHLPTAANGGLLVYTSQLPRIKFIEEVAGAVLNVSYYG